MDRRSFLRLSAGAVAGASLSGCQTAPRPTWRAAAQTKSERSAVAVLAVPEYAEPALEDAIRRGIRLFALDVRGKRVVLKPNLVEFDPGGVINTNPRLIAAAVHVFRSLGAASVVVAEGPGHRRDNEYLLAASGLEAALADAGARYVDLNWDRVHTVPTLSTFTRLGALHLPATILEADLLVSMPKLKTHHWAGMTLSMKNFFGIMPGSLYGWPKNVLHWAGIDGSIVDINAVLTMPRFNIVDGIVGMEGNGPIQGTPRRSGVLVFGTDPVAVDATGARLMRLDPSRITYLRDASAFLGNIEEEQIHQLAEDPRRFVQDYAVLPQFQRLKPSSPLGTAG